MYTVIWCGQDGNQQERRFYLRTYAVMEAMKLLHRFDGVDIVDSETGEPVALM